MALVDFAAVGARDTDAIDLGLSRRIAVYEDAIYLVTLSDLDSFIHVYKWDDGEVSEYTSSGVGDPTTSAVTQNMLAVGQTKDTLHIAYLTVVSSQKQVSYLRFDMSTDAWVGGQELALTGGNSTPSDDALDLCVASSGVVHVAVWYRNGSSTWDLKHLERDTDGAWSSDDVATGGSTAPVFSPCIDVDAAGRTVILSDNGASDLTETGRWLAWWEISGTWSGQTMIGLGQATLTHTKDGLFHALFFGDKRHTIIKRGSNNVDTTLGALQFEQPDVDGGIIQGTNYGFGFAARSEGSEIHVVAAANGKLYQARWQDGVWETLRAVKALTASRTSKLAVTMATRLTSTDSHLAVAVKQDDAGSKGWFLFELNQDLPPRGGITHNLVIDDTGYMAAGPLQKADISQAVPRVSIATELKTEDNVSDLSSVSQYSFHHGRGELFFEDPMAFFDADGLLTHIPNQVTPQYYPQVTSKSGAGAGGSALVGPAGEAIGPSANGVGPNVPATDAQSFAGHVSDATLYQGNFYILIYGDLAAGNALHVWNNTNGVWDAVSAGLDTTSGVPSDLEIHNEDLWVAQGDTVNARVYDKSADSWGAATVPADCFKEWDHKLWRADNINEIYYSEDADTPGSETWTLLGTVDDGAGTTSRIRGFEAYGGTLLVFADFGVHQVIPNADGSSSYLLLPLLDDAAVRHAKNGIARANFGGILFYNAGDGLTRFDGATRSEVGPNRSQTGSGKFQGLPEAKRGQFSDLVATDTLMYLAIDAGTTGRSTVQVYGGTGWNEFWQANADGERCRWVFHTPSLTTTGVLATRNLWVESGGKVYRIQLPRHGENPLNDTDVTYRAGGQYSLVTGWQHHSLPSLNKVLHELLARFDGFSSSPFEPNLHVYFQTEDGTDSFDTDHWTYLTTFSQNPVENANVLNRIKWSANPDDYGGAVGGLVFKHIRFMILFDMDIGGAASTMDQVVLRSFGQRFAIRTERRFGFTAVLQAYNEITLLDRSLERDRADEIRNELYALADARTPRFVDDGTLVPLVNWVINPGFELDSDADGLADEWTQLVPASVTTALSSKHKVHGRYSQRISVGATYLTAGVYQRGLYLPPGVEGHIDVELFVESGVGAQLLVTDASNGEILARSKPVFPFVSTRPPALFTQVSVDIEAQSTLKELGLQVVVPSTMANNSTSTVFHADSALFYLGSDVPHYYIDGEQPRCQWVDDTVEPYLSPSFRRGTYAVYITGLNEVYRTIGEVEGGESEIESEITLLMREASP